MTHQSIITPDLGEKVIQTLGRYARMPSSGIVAGQSVASAIDEVLGRGTPVYNDVDVFLDVPQWHAIWPQDVDSLSANKIWPDGIEPQERKKEQTLLAGRVMYFDDPVFDSDDYACKLSVAQRELYSIGQTRTDGLLNYVRVEWAHSAAADLDGMPDEIRPTQQMQWLTKVFDMNCTQAAVDLATGRLHVSPQFERFLHSRQLQVVTGYTPVHSLLRFLKKRDELKVFGNEDMHVRMLHRLVQHAQGDAALTTLRRRKVREGHAMLSYQEIQDECKRQGIEEADYLTWTRAGQGRNCKPLSFGRKYYDQYVKYQKLLNPYFVLTRHEKKDVWLLTSKTVDAKFDSYTEYQSPAVVALNFAEEDQAPSKTAKARDEGFNILLEALGGDGRHYAFKRARGNMGRAYCEGMEDENLRRRWLAVAPKHHEFFWTTVALPFKQQMELLRKMRTSFKKMGIDCPWGALGYKTATFVRNILADDERWQDFLDSNIGTFAPLCKPLPMPKEFGNVQVRELITSRDLRVEGYRMHHCVGGYSSAVEDGHSRIIALSLGESSTECSTVEWRIARHFEGKEPGVLTWPSSITLELRQNYGPSNNPPKQELVDVELKLREQLNGWIRDNWDEAIVLLGIEPEEAPKPYGYGRQILAELEEDIPF